MPGYLTNKLAPSYLADSARGFDRGVVFVLGSNGKTTTTHMLSDVLRAHGLRVFTNPTGANLPQGITSALLAECSATGLVTADVAVLEVDEAFAADLADVFEPSIVLSLNVQVDQLYRFFEMERVADMMLEASTRATKAVVINRDDPHLSKIDTSSLQAPVTFFGVAPPVLARSAHGLVNAIDTRSGTAVTDVGSAHSEVAALDGRQVTIALGSESVEVMTPTRGLHYAVDAAAAVAAAQLVLGDSFSPETTSAAFHSMKPAYGRGEVMPLDADRAELVEFVMFKNGPSLQLNLDALVAAPERLLLGIDEGTPDVSWLYDVDLDAIDHVDVVTGDKAHQLATRLAYAGVSIGIVEPDLTAAVAIMRSFPATNDGRQTWFVNYELMMIARRLLGHGDQEGRRS